MNFYKITNKEEIHYGMRYTTGLNEDTLPLNSEGNCESGGIYFSREDILAFLYKGIYIRKVTIPDGEPVYQNPGAPVKWKAKRVILGERSLITPELIQRLIMEGANIHADNDCALRWATDTGRYDIVKLLLENGANIHANRDCVLRYAAVRGHYDIVKLLIENGVNIHMGNDDIICWATDNGRNDIVKLLLRNNVNIHANNDYALRWAIENNNYEVVKMLLEHGADVNECSEWDIERSTPEIAELINKYRNIQRNT